MIVSCPHCGARYKIQDELLGENGKRVKCKKCESVFRALTNGESVLEAAGGAQAAEAKTPQQAPPAAAPPKPAEKPAPSPLAQAPGPIKVSVGGTSPFVKVDNSRVNDYLKTLDDASSQASAPTRPISTANSRQQPAVGATIQIDRSQIDAFLRQAQSGNQATDAPVATPAPQSMPIASPKATSANPPPFDDTSGATIRADRQQLNAFLNQNKTDLTPAEDPGMATIKADRQQLNAFLQGQDATLHTDPDKTPEDDTGDFSGGATMRVTPEQLAKAFGGEKPQANLDTGATLKIKVPTDFSKLEATIPGEPSFPSDDQLGLSDTDTTDPIAAPVALTLPTQTSAPPPAKAEPPVQQQTLYKALIEGQTYESLTLVDLERWIQEARLLETDQLAPMATEAYKTALSYPEIATLFARFSQAEAEAHPTPAKKGFFAWLLGLFKKG